MVMGQMSSECPLLNPHLNYRNSLSREQDQQSVSESVPHPPLPCWSPQGDPKHLPSGCGRKGGGDTSLLTLPTQFPLISVSGSHVHWVHKLQAPNGLWQD